MIKSENFRLELLSHEHIRTEFSCGEHSLDRYIQQQASQDLKKKIAAIYVLTSKNDSVVVGYFTLSNYGIEPGHLAESERKKLPRYTLLPATLIGRLAISKEWQGNKLGEFLLLKALQKSHELSIVSGSYAVVVEAINDSAVRFYASYGFLHFHDKPSKLYLPMKNIMELAKVWRS